MLLLLSSDYHETVSILDLLQYFLIPRKSLVNATQLIKLLNSIRPFATSDHVVQNPPCWRASSLLFPHWDIKTKRPEPVKLDLPVL